MASAQRGSVITRASASQILGGKITFLPLAEQAGIPVVHLGRQGHVEIQAVVAHHHSGIVAQGGIALKLAPHIQKFSLREMLFHILYLLLFI